MWGGYEVTTRVMLKNLLPEGAAIPATRGELAQLLWNAAGRPEAGAVVTVYPDITDADQQAAARWCTEQGLLTARSDGISVHQSPQLVRVHFQKRFHRCKRSEKLGVVRV